jgi:hypothetical protein
MYLLQLATGNKLKFFKRATGKNGQRQKNPSKSVSKHFQTAASPFTRIITATAQDSTVFQTVYGAGNRPR